MSIAFRLKLEAVI